MSSYLEQLDSRKATAANRMREILDGAAAENRELTAEENANLETIDVDLSRFTAERTRIVAMDEKAAADSELRAKMENVIAANPRTDRAEKSDREKLAGLFSAIRGGGQGGSFESHLSDEFRALDVADEGPDVAPQTLYDAITVYERTLTPMLNPSVVTVLNTTMGEPITLPRLTADPTASGTLVAEAAAITEADPTVSSVVLNAYKYAVINLWSAELDLDNTVGLEDVIARSSARELAIGIGTALTTADGSSKPQGFIGVATNGGTATGTANNTFIGPDDIIDLFFGRAAPYRSVGTWQASTTGVAKIRKLKNADGDYMWVQGLGGAPDTVLGRPIYENPAMAAVASASKSVAFGDFSRYFVRRVTPARIDLSREYKFSTDQVALRTIERIDGDLVDTAAVAFLVSANA